MTSSKCPFCNFNQPGVTIFADRHVQAFISLSPINRYHVLVVPRAHYERLADLPSETLTSVMRVVQRVSVAVRAVARPDAVSHLSDDDLTGLPGSAANEKYGYSNQEFAALFAVTADSGP